MTPAELEPLTGMEPFIGIDARVSDFWRFALSDLRMNNARGYLAEWLVAQALGMREIHCVEWDDVDLLLDRIPIEVKSSAYLQAWDQRQLSTIQFTGLQGTRYRNRSGYDPAGKRFKAHVYVFCVQTARTHAEYHPLDVTQWDFYVVRRSQLVALGQKSVGLVALCKLVDVPTPWDQLRDAVVNAAVGEERPEDAAIW